MTRNKLLIAAAGAGKTTYLIERALEQTEPVLITTYTEDNEAEIRRKIIKLKGAIPAHITIQTWFSFLIQHGAKPYQGVMTPQKISGLLFVNTPSGMIRNTKGVVVSSIPESKLEAYYFTIDRRIFSDKLSKFVCRCDEKSNGNVIDRIARIYPNILVDEVQDLAGYDLDILKLLFQSNASVTLVGDPRQVTYSTHPDSRFSQYKDGKIEEFVNNECKKLDCEIDKETLKYSHRNNSYICEFSSLFYPHFPPSEACKCDACRSKTPDHVGIFIVRPDQVSAYREAYNPTVLRYRESVPPEWNFGKSKGLGFDRVLIYPIAGFIGYLKDGKLTKTVNSKPKDAFDIAKTYVAVTRARHSVAIVVDYKEKDTFINGVLLI